MRLKVHHQATYVYAQPARSAVQILRLTPRSFDGHFVQQWRVEVDSDARLDKGEDAFGNVTHTVSIEGPVTSVRVGVEGVVDTVDTHGIVRGTSERLPPGVYLRETALTRPSPAISEIIGDASDADDTLGRLHRLTARLRRSLSITPDRPAEWIPVEQVLSAKSGTYRDLAHVFLAAARGLRIPARYVAGYFLRADSSDKDASHAWAEAHLEGLGWIGFDATEGLCTTDRYVRVAIGLDGLDAAPIRGSHVGGGGESLSVASHIAQCHSMSQA
jgi:transglutaminase-like putative cysteine protease